MASMDELIQRISELENENNELKKWQQTVNQLLQQMLDMITQQGDAQQVLNENFQSLKQYASVNRFRIDALPYELQDPDYHSFFFKPHILSKAATRRRLIEGASFARLGDGEFAAIVGQKRWNFQGESEILGERLKEVLSSDDKGLMIGLHPTFYMNLFDFPEEEADGVRAYMRPMVRRLHAELLDKDKQYGDALFHNIRSEEDLAELKKIWNEKDCVFIEGVHTCMGVGNNLFNNCRTVVRILGPAENAIDKYDDIMKEALKQPKDKLFLLALGPTATVLAYDLYNAGYQAIDIGHIDLIYESYLRKLPNLNSVNISYKYCRVDECVAGRTIENADDPEYKSQIIAVIDS